MATSEQLAEWRTCPRCPTLLEHAASSVRCPSCGLEEYANPAPTASAVVRDRDGRILLARRADEPGAGLWDLLGGFMDEGEDPLETLRRELREETGLEVEPGEYLGALPDRYGDDGPWTVNFYWETRIAPGEPRPADDVAELAWFEAEALPPRSEFAFANTVELLERVGASFA
jgi:8-oxo-dGTP diphosphatase